MNDDRILVNAREAARLLSLDISQVYDLAATGKLERRYIGKGTRSFRIPVESLQQYADDLSRDPLPADTS